MSTMTNNKINARDAFLANWQNYEYKFFANARKLVRTEGESKGSWLGGTTRSN